MSIKFQSIKPLGEKGILIEFESEISENTLEKVLWAKKILLSKTLKEKVEVISAYNSLLIFYHYCIEDVYSEILQIKILLEGANIGKKLENKIFYIPVSYDVEFGWDIEEISAKKNIPVEEIIQLHSEPIYTVYFLGFLPGFLYLGGLSQQLNFPRKNQPRMEVQKGAVGIGGNQTGIYPKKSPGGWQIIGNTPVELFDKSTDPPSQFSAGDRVKFYPVSRQEYFSIKNEVLLGNYRLRKEIFHD